MTFEQLLDENQRLRQELSILRQQLDWFKRRVFGRTSEKSGHPEHPELFGPREAEGEAPKKAQVSPGSSAPAGAAAGAAKLERRTRRSRLPENLPVVEREVVPPEVAAEPGRWRRVGEDTCDRLEKEPGHFYILRERRGRYVRIDDPVLPPVCAPAPKRLVEGAFWGPGLAAEIISNKHLYHIPLHRQEQLYRRRFDVWLPRSTMSDMIESAAAQCGILISHIRKRMLEGAVVQVDETPVTDLDREHPKGSSRGFMWVYHSPSTREVLFDWRTTREHGNLAKWMGPDYRGLLQADGYEAADAYVLRQKRRGLEVVRVACMAHIRRKFHDALGERPALAGWFLKQIGRLYGIEGVLREGGATPAMRLRIRGLQSRGIMGLIYDAVLRLRKQSNTILPKSAMGRALDYTLGQWAAMMRYLDDGLAEIDNNLIENCLRPVVLGRKNHLFIGDAEAGGKSAVFYSLLASAAAQGVDPQAYLKDVFDRLPLVDPSDQSALEQLRPSVWAAAFKACRADTPPAALKTA